MPAATTLSSPLPSPAAHHSGSSSDNISPLFVILLAPSFVGIPICIYAFFMFLKCSPNPFHPRRPSSSRPAGKVPPGPTLELVTDLKFSFGDGKDYGSECPVCLSVFVDGEDVRQLKACQHVFHGAVASFSLELPCLSCFRARQAVEEVGGDDDFRQGLPDSASLI